MKDWRTIPRIEVLYNAFEDYAKDWKTIPRIGGLYQRIG